MPLRCFLKAGGRLVYSTCTFAPAENEGAIAAFCAAIRILRWKPPARLLGFFALGEPLIGPRARTQRWRRPAASGPTSCPARALCCRAALLRRRGKRLAARTVCASTGGLACFCR